MVQLRNQMAGTQGTFAACHHGSPRHAGVLARLSKTWEVRRADTGAVAQECQASDPAVFSIRLCRHLCTSHPSQFCHAGALARLFKTGEERRAVVGAVAQECQASGQLSWAVELYEQAGQAPSALHVVATQLALLLQPALTSAAKGGPAPRSACPTSELVIPIADQRQPFALRAARVAIQLAL